MYYIVRCAINIIFFKLNSLVINYLLFLLTILTVKALYKILLLFSVINIISLFAQRRQMHKIYVASV